MPHPSPTRKPSTARCLQRRGSRFTAPQTRLLSVRLLLTGLLLLASLWLPACAPPPASEGDFTSDNPASRLYAIHRAGTEGDRSALPGLVESLDHDDPAVRMMAAQALERITGTRMGYDPYAGAIERRKAADAWAQAIRDQRFDPRHAAADGVGDLDIVPAP